MQLSCTEGAESLKPRDDGRKERFGSCQKREFISLHDFPLVSVC